MKKQTITRMRLFIIATSIFVFLLLVFRYMYYMDRELETGGLRYHVTNGQAFVTGFYDLHEEVVIPDKVYWWKVIGIEQEAFHDCEEIESIILDGRIESIGDWAFLGCVNLDSIKGIENVKIIRDRAFEGTLWLEKQTDEFVIVGDGNLIRYNGNSGEIIIPNGVKNISVDVFASAKCDTIYVPDSVETIAPPIRGGFEGSEFVTVIFQNGEVDYFADWGWGPITIFQEDLQHNDVLLVFESFSPMAKMAEGRFNWRPITDEERAMFDQDRN